METTIDKSIEEFLRRIENGELATAGDMFCGFGGTTEGMLASNSVNVVWAINHDKKAIDAHKENHPDVKHYLEDIIDLDEHKLEPVDILWASLECTHFSNAKGGQDRDPDSRMLAEEMYRYVDHLRPMYIMIENVREFMSWGPVKYKRDEGGRIMRDKKGRGIRVPIKEKKGEYYRKWLLEMKKRGYEYDWRLLNAADFGAYTSRTRYFAIFAKKGLPIEFPEPTHSKTGANELPKWKAVREVLDLEDEGKSIFDRKKDLAENTLKRIASGIWKHGLSKEEKEFIVSYYSNGDNNRSVEEPLPVITTKDRHAIIKVKKNQFLSQHLQGAMNNTIEKPMPTVVTKDLKTLVTINFIANNYNNGADRVEKFIAPQYGKSKTRSLGEPIGALGTNNHEQLITTKKQQFLYKYFSNGPEFASINKPVGAIMTNDKNSLTTIEILDQMIVDIKMRYLHTHELAKAQGFPENYYLGGTKREQTKHIGNSVVPEMGKLIPDTCIQELKHKIK